MRRALLVLLPLASVVLGGLVAGGCQQAQAIGGKTRPKIYRRIVSLSPSTTEVLATSGIPLSGRTAACDYPENVKVVPVVAGVKPDYEALAKVEPDLIVYDSELYGDAEIRKMEATGAKLVPYDPNSIDDYERSIYELGSLCGIETSLSGSVDAVNNEERIALGDPITPKPKVAIILPDAGGRHLIAGTKGFRADVVRVAGGEQVGPDSDRFTPISAEDLVRENPDVIIVAGSPEDRAAFERDARFTSLKARLKSNVFSLPADIVLRRGARVKDLIRNVHKALALSVSPARNVAPPEGITPAEAGAPVTK